MREGYDFIYRPVICGVLSGEKLSDGSVDILDIARLNEALDVKFENERRLHEAAANRKPE